MLLRQVQARPLQGHHLRALRRRGDAAEGAPRAHGSHRPGRARLAHLVLQGRPEPHRLPARHRPARAREGALLRRLDHHRASTSRRARRTSTTSRTRSRPRSSASTSTATSGSPPSSSGSPAAARTSRQGKDKGFDEDDDFWARGLSAWAEEQMLPTARGGAQARQRPVRRARRPDHDRGREEDPRARPQRRDPRGPQAHPARARAGRRPRPSRSAARSPPLREGAGRGDAAPKKGAVSKHINRIVDALLAGEALDGDDADARRRRRREEPREGARPRQRPPARGRRPATDETGRPRARERPVPAHGREDPEGGPRLADPVGAEGARDVPRHRVAPRGHARGGGRLGQPARADLAALPRARSRRWSSTTSSSSASSRTASARRTASASTSGAAWARSRSATCSATSTCTRSRSRCATSIRTSKGQKQQRAIKRLKVCQAFVKSREQARVDDPRGRAGDPAGAPPDGAARRRPLRDERPERPLPARDQPQQPPEEAARPRRARDHRQQREAHAAGGRRRAVRQRPPRPRGHRPGQPAAEVAVRHAQGQAGPVPPEPARQARRLLGPLGDRGRAEPASCTSAACRS